MLNRTRTLIALVLLLASAPSVAAVEFPPLLRRKTFPACLDGIPPSRYQHGARSASEVAVSQTAILLRRGIQVSDFIQEPPRLLAKGIHSDQLLRRPGDRDGEYRLDRNIERTLQAGRHAAPGAWQQIEEHSRRHRHAELSLEELESGITRKTVRDEFTAVLPSPEPKRQTIVDLYQLDQASLQINYCAISEVAIQIHSSGHWVLSLRADQNRRPGPDEVVAHNQWLHIKRNEFVVRMRCLGAFAHPATETGPTTGEPVLVDLQPYSFWVENGVPRYVSQQGFDPLIQDHFRDIDRVEIEFFYR